MSTTEETRRESFEKIKRSLGSRQFEVYSILESFQGGITSWEVATRLNRPVYVVRPRLTELKSLGLIRAIAKAYHAGTNRMEAVWEIIPQDPMTFNFDDHGQGAFA